MTQELIVLTLAFALVATVTFAAGEGEESAAAEKEMVLDPSTGEMVTAPEYGGTIRPIVNFKNEGIDPYYRYTAGAWVGLVNEKLGVGDWAIDRSKVGYTTLFLPDEALTGQLAESWEAPGSAHLRVQDPRRRLLARQGAGERPAADRARCRLQRAAAPLRGGRRRVEPGMHGGL